MAHQEQAYDQLFVDDVDQTTDEEMVEEMYYSMIARHPYYVLDQAIALNIYGEPNTESDIDGAYTTVDPQFPFHVKLDPETEELEKYGYDRKRECVVWFCTKILKDIGIVPKVGDRFDFMFLTADRVTQVREHFIITEISDWDFIRQSKDSYQVSAAADRTQKKPIPACP